MVQIISRTRPTFGEQVASGLAKGAEQGLQFGQKVLGKSIEQKMAKQAIADKLAMLDKPEFSQFFKDIDPRYKQLAKMAAAGVIEPGVATSIAEMVRQGQTQHEFNKYFGGGNEPQADYNAPAKREAEDFSGGIPQVDFPFEAGRKGQQQHLAPQSDYESKINEIHKAQEKIRPALKSKDKLIRDTAQASINDLDKQIQDIRKEKEFSFKREKFGHQLEREHKEDVDKAYKVHEPFIQDVTNSYKGFESEMKPRLLQMQSMDPETLISPTASVFLEHLGIPLGALEDPHSELYQKLSQDLLKGLPETYGNRILKVEVDNFLQTIPKLINSPDGRRMIASNMLKLGEMKEVFYKSMRHMQQDYLNSDKPLPKDFEQRIFDHVLPQINRINEEFVKLSEITAVPPNHVPFFDPSGNIKFVPKDQQEWASKNGGRRIW